MMLILNNIHILINRIKIMVKIQTDLIFLCALLHFLAFSIFRGKVLVNELTVRHKNNSMI